MIRNFKTHVFCCCNFFMLCKKNCTIFFEFCFVFSKLGFVFVVGELYFLTLDMYYHSRCFYVMCCLCRDNNGYKCQHRNTQHENSYIFMNIHMKIFYPIYTCIIHVLNTQHLCSKNKTHEKMIFT